MIPVRKIRLLAYLSLLLLLIGVGRSNAQSMRAIPVNIFGDGNPVNGIEDDREQLLGVYRPGLKLTDQRLNAGTVVCDGKIRGSAMVIDTRRLAPELKGAVLISAAHVLYDLDKKQLFTSCEFHFLALGEIPGHKTDIDLQHVKMGGFNPALATNTASFGQGDWSFLYVPVPWTDLDLSEAVSVTDFSLIALKAFREAGGYFSLVAYDSSKGVMSISRHCTVIVSTAADLGGGLWSGQLLDDCDSADGASGGGIIATIDKQQYLIGIRGGAHWSMENYPAREYPQGPPVGAQWNKNQNTNFARAIDRVMLQKLRIFVSGLPVRKKFL